MEKVKALNLDWYGKKNKLGTIIFHPWMRFMNKVEEMTLTESHRVERLIDSISCWSSLNLEKSCGIRDGYEIKT